VSMTHCECGGSNRRARTFQHVLAIQARPGSQGQAVLLNWIFKSLPKDPYYFFRSYSPFLIAVMSDMICYWFITNFISLSGKYLIIHLVLVIDLLNKVYLLSS
jgi:hypothetical protein